MAYSFRTSSCFLRHKKTASPYVSFRSGADRRGLGQAGAYPFNPVTPARPGALCPSQSRHFLWKTRRLPKALQSAVHGGWSTMFGLAGGLGLKPQNTPNAAQSRPAGAFWIRLVPAAQKGLLLHKPNGTAGIALTISSQRPTWRCYYSLLLSPGGFPLSCPPGLFACIAMA